MADRDQRASYITLWVFALAFGWIEAATVVYLRATSPPVAGFATGVQFPLALAPVRLMSSEMVREACTMLVLAAVAWLGARRPPDRIGAFLLAFGVWDLAYYAALKLISGWPQALTNWDILFLIPLPWVAPVWAPATVALIFIAAGSYLFWTAAKPRAYTSRDLTILFASGAAIVASFLFEWRAVFANEVPRSFQQTIYWAALAVGTLWFVHVERREVVR